MDGELGISQTGGGGHPLAPHDWYLPLNILSITVADLTAVEEDKQVHNSGWAPPPRERKGSRNQGDPPEGGNGGLD